MSDIISSPEPSARPAKRFGLLRRAVFGLILLVGGISAAAWLTHAGIATPTTPQSASPSTSQTTAHERRASLLPDIKSWGYQLQNLDVAKAAASPFDLLVIDRAALNLGSRERAAQTLKRLQTKDGAAGQRNVLSYLSIGEAQDYRNYWRTGWVAPQPGPVRPSFIKKDEVAHVGQEGKMAPDDPGSRLRLFASHGLKRYVSPGLAAIRRPMPAAPKWLGLENSQRRGNYSVRFWQPEWKATMFGTPESTLDKIIAAGFDGVYLARADVYKKWQSQRRDAARDMISFIVELAAYARSQNPGFVIILQNGEELARDKSLRVAIDAIAKEDLFYGLEGSGKANALRSVENAVRYLKLVQDDGRPVLTVEYIDDPLKQQTARRTVTALGFVAYFGPRELDDLRLPGRQF